MKIIIVAALAVALSGCAVARDLGTIAYCAAQQSSPSRRCN